MKKYSLICFCVLFFLLSCDFMPYGDSVILEKDLPITVQPEDVVAMAKRYNKPELRNYYCCNECPIGKIDAPEVTYTGGVHEILVNMAVSLKNVNHEKIRLMEILEDGKVDNDEIEDYEKICEELEHISMTIEALQLWCEKMKLNKNK